VKLKSKNKEKFEDVIFSDKCTVQLENQSKLCFREKNQPWALKQCAKHPVKVHLWGGISCRGATRKIMFTGNMNAIRYGKILEEFLVPFVRACFPAGHT